MQKSIAFLLILLPFVYSKYSFSPYEIPKTWVLGLVALLSAGSFFYRVRLQSSEQRSSPILIALLTLWGWLLFSSLTSGHFWQSWAGNYYRADGLMTLTAMMIVGLCFKPEKSLWRGIGWGSVLLSLLTLWQGGETALNMGNPNFLAGYLAVTLPLTSVVGIVWVVPQLVAIGLLKSWGGALCGLLFVVGGLLWKKPKLMHVMMLVAGLGFGWLYRADQIRQNPQGVVVAEGRERIWTKGVMAVGQKPVMGWGWAQFGRAFKQIDWPVHYFADAHVERTHASLLEYGVAGGIPALLLYLYLAFTASCVLLKDGSPTHKMLGLVVVLYMIHSQTNVTSVAEDWLFFAGVGEAIRIQLKM